MSRLDDIKEAYDNIQVPAELKERVLLLIPPAPECYHMPL